MAMKLFSALTDDAVGISTDISNRATAADASSSPLSSLTLYLRCTPYLVDLRTAWKTSHSVSTQRRNALLTVKVTTASSTTATNSAKREAFYYGYGEVGMPPKNLLAGYAADYNDVEAYANATVIGKSPAFSDEAAAYLSQAVGNGEGAEVTSNVAVQLVALLWLHNELLCTSFKRVETSSVSSSSLAEHPHDEEKAIRKNILKMERFGRAGVEGALLDAMGRCLAVPSFMLAEAWLSTVTRQKQSLIDRLFVSHTNADDGKKSVVFITLDGIQHVVESLAPAFVAAVEAQRTSQLSSSTPPSPSSSVFKGYLTVGMADPAAMAEGVREALSQTRFIKLKLDGCERLSYARLMAIGVMLVRNVQTPSSSPSSDSGCEDEKIAPIEIVIDANSAWTPEKTRRFADNLKRMRNGELPVVPLDGEEKEEGKETVMKEEEYAAGRPINLADALKLIGDSVQMVEQPYPADFVANPGKYNADYLNSWKETLAYCNNNSVSSKTGDSSASASLDRPLKLFADESVCSVEDLALLYPFVNGINIKLEKCGGLLAAFEFVELATGEGSPYAKHIDFTWVGIMVGSRLLCNNAGQLLTRTLQGDVDGALLLTEASQQFAGGFVWATDVLSTSGNHACTHEKIRIGSGHGTITIDANAFGAGCHKK